MSELVERAQRGDHEAFNVFVTAAYDRMWAIAAGSFAPFSKPATTRSDAAAGGRSISRFSQCSRPSFTRRRHRSLFRQAS